MKRSILILSMLACVSTISIANDVNKSCSPCQEKDKRHHKKKETCAPTPISKAKTIKHSGCYCLTKDIEGTIVIAADNVSLDLNCHQIDADGNNFGVLIDSVQNVSVFNGSVTGSNALGSANAGIGVFNSTSVSLHDLFVHDNGFNGIYQENSQDLSVRNVDFQNGERALSFTTCHDVSVASCNMSGYVSTIRSVFGINDCHCVSVVDVNVCDNIKNAGAPTIEGQRPFVFVVDSEGVNLTRVVVNNNSNVNPALEGYSAIDIRRSHGTKLTECQTSNNTDSAGGINAQDIQVLILSSDNVVVTDHQANNNTCPTILLTNRAYNAVGSFNTVFDGCQANNNYTEALPASSSFSPDLTGFFMQDAGLGNGNNVLRNCQANFNRVNDTNNSTRGAKVAGIRLEGSSVVDNCQGCFNSTGGVFRNIHFVYGLLVEQRDKLVTDVTIENSSFDNNTGANPRGLLLHNGTRCVVRNCTANANGGRGMATSVVLGSPIQRVDDIAFIDCVCNGNGFGFPQLYTTAGIQCAPCNEGTHNLLIKGCQANNTFAPGNSARGIDVIRAFNVVVEDCTVGSTTSGDYVSGLKLSDVTNGRVSNCLVGDTNATAATAFFGVAGIALEYPVNVVIEDTIVFNTTGTGEEGFTGPDGIQFFGLGENVQINRSQSSFNQRDGINVSLGLDGAYNGISIIETKAIQNGANGVNFSADSTATCCLVQDSVANGNAVAGFVHGPTPLSTTFIGNEAQCNGLTADDNYQITGGTINLQELKWSDGSVSQVTGSGAVLGSPVANLRIVN